MVYTIPLIIFMDDMSGNISKQWNKHHTIYMSNANLPREMLEKEFFVDAAQSGVSAWDCKYDEEVMLIPYGLFLAGDNPMQAEECSHAGLSCNYFCRTCDVGRTKAYKESEAGYNSIFMTSQEIRQQFETAFKSGVQDSASSSILNTLIELGKKLRKCTMGSQALPENEIEATLQKEFEELLKGGQLDNTINPLLGMEGYTSGGRLVFLLEKAKFLPIFQYRLESVDKDRLNAPCLNADYICHYKGSLIRKHFKIPPTVLNAWTVIGELVVLVWHTRITDTETYLACLIPLRDRQHYLKPSKIS
ncbi:uncharacterized protein EDB91DRAFT_1240223 [Suillus paluster]|uniref:uncharacterized protein n=1 Tax=Suillus paluster TaxID=48578 RepID=UPI001B882934|nr:uncharacterized protein EDB91DRAFT_1240223 [Suillus paluster]KAG1722393.1 hypothetical protein EDB91DRAFT_1240223 [Suillus paluster]